MPQRRAHVRYPSQPGHRRRSPVEQAQPARPAIPEMHYLSRRVARLQQRPVLPEVNAMMKTLRIALAAFGALHAQPVIAPTPEQVGSARGENSGNYNITNTF